jgi:hypothetical protein
MKLLNSKTTSSITLIRNPPFKEEGFGVSLRIFLPKPISSKTYIRNGLPTVTVLSTFA